MKNIVLIVASLLFCSMACNDSTRVNSEEEDRISDDPNTFYVGQQQVDLPTADSMTVLFLVRHAEKAEGSDPELTAAGQKRADRIAKFLKGVGVDNIYATNYNRTIATAKPLALVADKSIISYDPNDLITFQKEVLNNNMGKKALIVGHSNTTPRLLNIMLGEKRYEDIDESDYGNFYVVVIDKEGSATIKDLRF